MPQPYRLFERFGVELEYMIVDRATLDVRPISDELIRAVAGAYQSDVDFDDLSWSNELVLHVIELKTNGPSPALEGLAGVFQRHVARINALLDPLGARLMPAAMHPWMDPLREMRLWPHEYNAVYEAFNRIFDCRGHGWANLQCTHVNLPFADDEEFGRLHAAVRLLLPILPALAASSPIVEGRRTGLMDARLAAYRGNARRIPSVTGHVIPEPVYTFRDYDERILQRIYRDVAPFDPEQILREQWMNARGAIARFDRGAIEIRVLDVQECPAADLAILALVVETLRALVDERLCPYDRQRPWPVEPLEAILSDCILYAEDAVIRDPQYLAALGVPDASTCTAGEIWRRLRETLRGRIAPEFAPALDVILERGPLSRRILRATGPTPDRERLAAVYRALCDALAKGEMFVP